MSQQIVNLIEEHFYSWVCPNCHHENEQENASSPVCCYNCSNEFEAVWD